jgi:hypothetical protein
MWTQTMPLFSIVNIVGFQAAWFSAALLRDQALWLMIPLLAIHFYFSPSKRSDLNLVLYLLPLGLLAEALLILTGMVSYNSALALPLWMVLLWVHLIVSCNHSLKWLQKTSALWVGLLGGLAGASSYVPASKFGALEVNEPQLLSLAIIGTLWAALILIMTQVAKYNNQKVIKCTP